MLMYWQCQWLHFHHHQYLLLNSTVKSHGHFWLHIRPHKHKANNTHQLQALGLLMGHQVHSLASHTFSNALSRLDTSHKALMLDDYSKTQYLVGSKQLKGGGRISVASMSWLVGTIKKSNNDLITYNIFSSKTQTITVEQYHRYFM